MNRRIAWLLGAWVLCATPVWAGIGGHNGEIGFDFGGASLDKGLTDKDAARASIRGGYHFTSLLQIEGQDVGLRAKDSSGGTDTTTSVFAVFANAVFNFHPGRRNVVPYLLGLLPRAPPN